MHCKTILQKLSGAPVLKVFFLLVFLSGVFHAASCVGATQNFTCGDSVSESCTLNGNVSIDDSTCFSIGANNIELDCAGFAISGNGAYSTNGIFISSKSNVIIKNCKIFNFEEGVYLQWTYASKLLNNTVYGMSDSAFYLSFSNYNNQFRGNTVHDNQYSGFYLDSSCQSNTFANNMVYNTPGEDGTGFSISGNSANNIFIENVVYNISTEGFYLDSSEGNIFIENVNELDYDGADQKFYSNMYSSHNTFSSGNTGWWPLLDSNGSDADDQTRTAWYNGTSGGRNADGTDNSSLQYWYENQTPRVPSCFGETRNFSCGDLITESCTMGANASINDLTCFEMSEDNVELDCAGFTISGNGEEYGIYLNGVANATVRNCNVFNFSVNIYLSGSSGNKLLNNSAYGAISDGFDLGENSSNNNLTGNVAYDNKYDGFYIYDGSSENILENNVVYGSMEDAAIYLDSSDSNIFTNNTLHDNYLGFYMSSSSSNLFINNTNELDYGDTDQMFYSDSSLSTLSYGNIGWWPFIDSDGSDAEYQTDTAWYNGTEGGRDADGTPNQSLQYWYLNQSSAPPACIGETQSFACGDTVTESCTLNGNVSMEGDNCFTIRSNDTTIDCNGSSIIGDGTESYYGIYAQSASNITVQNCTIHDFAEGIYFSGVTGGRILNNFIYNCNSNGIYLEESSSINCSNNVVRNNNFGLGISLTTDSVFDGNAIYGNTARGLYMQDASRNIFKNNVLYNNSGYGIYLTSLAVLSDIFINNTNELDYNGTDQKFYSDSSQSTQSYGNTGWWPLLDSQGSDSNLQENTAWYNGTEGGRDYDGTPNPSLQYWYMNQSSAPPVCVGETQSFTCGDYITESCTLNGNLLTDDSDCFTISANDITLDCAGYSITGNGAVSYSGVYINGYETENVTVRNCTISNFGYGVRVYYTYYSTFSNNVLHDNGNAGFYIEYYSLDNIFEDNAVYNMLGGDGFYLSYSEGNTIRNNIAYNNSGLGFNIESSANNFFINNTNELDYNGTDQKFYSDSSQDTGSYNNTGWWPLLESDGSDATDQTYTAWYNGTAGGRNYDGSENLSLQYWYDNKISPPPACVGATQSFMCEDEITESCVLNGNLSSGPSCFTISANDITLDCAGYSIAGGNVVGSYGIYLEGYEGNTIKNCDVSGFQTGIYLSSASNTMLINNIAHNNSARRIFPPGQLAGTGFQLDYYSSGNTFINNTAYGNARYGFYLEYYSENNLFINNTNELDYNGVIQKFYSPIFQNTSSYGNTGWWPLLDSDGGEADSQEFTAWYNGTSGGRNADGSANLNLFYWYNNAGLKICPACGSVINESCGLDDDLSIEGSTCFTMGANDVMVNCAGHSITGDNTLFTYGIYSNNPGTIVRNCVISGFDAGIYINNTGRAVLESNTINVSTNNAAVSPYSSGILIYGGTGYNSINQNTLYSQYGNALYLYSSNHNNVTSCSASSYRARGIFLTSSSSNRIENSIGASSTNHGIRLQISSNNQIVNTNATSDSSYALYLLSSANNNVFTNSILSSGANTGIRIVSASNNLFVNSANTIHYNGRIQKFYSNLAQNISSSGNTGWWPLLASSGSDAITQSKTAWYNSSGGRNADGSANSSLRYWHESAYYGVSCAGATQNFICGQTITESCTMNVSLSINGSTCFTIGADDVVVDCNGYSLIGNNASNTYAIYSEKSNTSVRNCIISGFDTGIYFNGSSNGLIENNNVNAFVSNYAGPSQSSAVAILAESNNNRLINNTVHSEQGSGVYLDSSSNNSLTSSTSTSDGNYGIELTSSSNNSLTSSTGASPFYGISLQSSNGNTIINSTGSSSGSFAGIAFLSFSANNNLINSTGISDQGNGIYLSNSDSNNITNSFGISNESPGIYIQSSNNTLINSTFTLISVGASNSNNLFINCTNSIDYSGIDQKFNSYRAQSTKSYGNTGWWPLLNSDGSDASSQENTAWYNGSEGGRDADGTPNPSLQYWYMNKTTLPPLHCIGATQNFTCGDTVTESCTLNESVSISGSTCFTLGADNIALDCNGYSITGDATGSTYGIYALGRNNITIQNCLVSSFGTGILLQRSNNSVINNTISSDGSTGLRIYNSYENRINNLTASGTSEGIRLDTDSASNTSNILTSCVGTSNSGYGMLVYIAGNNTIADSDFTSNTGYGVWVYQSRYNNLVNVSAHSSSSAGIIVDSSPSNNLIDSIGTSSSYPAIYLTSSPNSNIIGSNGTSDGNNGIFVYRSNYTNIINSTGISGGNDGGIVVSSSYNNIVASTGIATGDSGAGIYLPSSYNNIVDSTGIARGQYGRGIKLSSSSFNNISNSHAILSGSYGTGFLFFSYSENNTLLNCTTVLDTDGQGFDIDFSRNNLFINCTNSIDYNGTAQAFYSTHAQNTSSYGNTGWWPLLTSNGSDVLEIANTSWYNGTSGGRDANGSANASLQYWYGNQTSFAPINYSTCIGATRNFVCGQTITENCIMDGNLSISGATCFTIGADNIEINCNGSSIIGDNTIYRYGIYSTRVNTTIRNCIINGFFDGIYYDGAKNGTIENNMVNITRTDVIWPAPSAIHLYNSNNNLVNNNTAYSQRVGILIEYYSANNIVSNSTGSAIGSVGIYLYSSTNSTIINSVGTSNSSIGIYLSQSPNNTLINSTATSNSNTGIYAYASSGNLFINCTNSLDYNGTSQKFSSDSAQNISSSGNMGWWPLFDSNGSDADNQTRTAWYNGPAGGRNADGSANSSLHYWYANKGEIGCVSPTQIFLCGQTITESCTLNGNVSINGSTCFSVTAENVSINCGGYTISGNNTLDTWGIYTAAFNTSVRNCNIKGFDVGIYFNTTKNGTIENNNVNSTVDNWANPTYSSAIFLYDGANFNTLNNNTAYSQYGKGISLTLSSNNTITNSTGTGHAGGIYLFENCNNNNIINSTGTGDLTGIYLFENCNNNSIINSTGNSGLDGGIYLDTCFNNNILDSTGTATTRVGGIYFLESSNNNVINSTGTAPEGGIELDGSSNNTITNSKINGQDDDYGALTLYGDNTDNTIANCTINGLTAARAITLSEGTNTGNLFINNTILNATILVYLNIDSSDNTFCLNNFSDSGTAPTTYINDTNGSNSYNCTYATLNQGNIYPNVLNGSVQILANPASNSSISGLYIGSFGSGYPYNSTNSDGKVAGDVTDYAPLTNILSYGCVGATTTFLCNQTITESCTMNGNLSINGSTCFTIGANNTVVDCASFSLSGNDVDYTYGFYLNGRSNVTIRNCTIQHFGDNIYLVESVNNTITRNYISHGYATGINIINRSTGNTISYNSLASNGGVGLKLYRNSHNNTVLGNIINDSNHQGIYIHNSTQNTVRDNLVVSRDETNSMSLLLLYSYENTFINSTFTSPSNESNTYGIQLLLRSNNNLFMNCTNSLDYEGTAIKFSSDSPQNISSYGNTGWWPFVNSNGSDAATQNMTAWYNGTSGGRNADGNANSSLSYWYGNNGPQTACVGATYKFLCGETINESCTMHGNLAINGSTCFRVGANNLAIDCNGFSLRGNDTLFTYGIYSNKSNTTVRNCVITGFDAGIYINSTGAALLESNTINVSTRNVEVSPYSSGILIYGGSGYNSLTNNTAYSQYGNAIYLYLSSHNNVTNCTASSYGARGIFLTSSSNNNILDSSGYSNTNHGLRLQLSNNNIITNSNGTSNTSYGLYLVGANANSFTGSTSASNKNTALRLASASNNLFTDCTNSIAYSGKVQMFYSNYAQNTASYGNTGWWPLLNSSGSDTITQSKTAWYNATAGRNADGTANASLLYWYGNQTGPV